MQAEGQMRKREHGRAPIRRSPHATDRAITGSALDRARHAALTETGGGRVTETEVGDEESMYEVEVTLDDGSQVDVQLDRSFRVVGSEQDSEENDGS
jgi:uncharacterized membrane protein YkoI